MIRTSTMAHLTPNFEQPDTVEVKLRLTDQGHHSLRLTQGPTTDDLTLFLSVHQLAQIAEGIIAHLGAEGETAALGALQVALNRSLQLAELPI